MSTIETPKKILTSEVCLLCKAKVFSEEKIKVFGKSTVAIHSLILHSTEVDLSVYGSDLCHHFNTAPDVIIICLFSAETSDSRKYICIRRLHLWWSVDRSTLNWSINWATVSWELAHFHHHIVSQNLLVINRQKIILCWNKEANSRFSHYGTYWK